MTIDPKIIRIQYIVNSINSELEKRKITKTELAERIWITQPAVTPFLTMKRMWTDDYYEKIMKWFLTESEIKKIFQKADEELYKYKYWKEINNNSEEIEKFKKMTREEQREYFLWQMALSVNWKNREAFIADVDKTIDFFLEKYK